MGPAPPLHSQDSATRPARHAPQTSHADALFDAAVDAGLAHELSWAAVQRIVANLPDEDDPCPYCGGLLQRWSSEPHDRAWRCQACGRLTLDKGGDGRLDKERVEEIGRAARESWALVEVRIAARKREVA